MGKGKYKERISETRSGYSSEAEDLCLADAGPWFLSPVLGEEDVGGGVKKGTYILCHCLTPHVPQK